MLSFEHCRLVPKCFSSQSLNAQERQKLRLNQCAATKRQLPPTVIAASPNEVRTPSPRSAAQEMRVMPAANRIKIHARRCCRYPGQNASNPANPIPTVRQRCVTSSPGNNFITAGANESRRGKARQWTMQSSDKAMPIESARERTGAVACGADAIELFISERLQTTAIAVAVVYTMIGQMGTHHGVYGTPKGAAPRTCLTFRRRFSGRLLAHSSE